MEIAATDGVALSVDVWDGRVGTGLPPFLLVHGLASNARLWHGVAQLLSGAGAPVAAVDQRGHGRSQKVDHGYDHATLAADLLAVVEALGWSPAVAAGQSWGADVVLELARREPGAVRGVACVDGGWTDLSHFPTFEACVEALAPPRTEGVPAAELEASLRRRHPDWPASGIRGVLGCFEVREDGTVAPWLTRDRHLAILGHMWERRPASVWPEVAAPVLLLPCDDGSGRSDRRRSGVEAAGRALARSRTRWFRADHDVHAQQPEAVAEVLLGAVADGFFA